MSERIDHAAEAARLLAYVAQLNATVDGPRIQHMTILAAGHAGLAGVEQQRVANVIALMQVEMESDTMPTDALDAVYEREPISVLSNQFKLHTRPEIKEALGL